MPDAVLTRFENEAGCTLGRLALLAEEQPLFSLEPPWLGNAPGKSCIPPGDYACVRRRSPRYGETYWLQGTEPRSFILIHPGNLVRHTRGCILLGARTGWLGGERAVLTSRKAVRALEDHFGREPFTLRIEREKP